MPWWACAYACVQTYTTEANRNKTSLAVVSCFLFVKRLKGIVENSLQHSNNLYGKRIWKRIGICIHKTKSLCCTPEPNTASQVNYGASLVAQKVKRLSAVQETRVRSPGWEDPLEKEMAAHSSNLAWKIPWAEEPGGLQSMGSWRVRHDWATSLSLFTFHFHALEKEVATHSSVLAWRIPGSGEPGGLLPMGLHRVGHDWSDLAAAIALDKEYAFLENRNYKLFLLY